MADDWQAGDAALCVDASNCPVTCVDSGLTEGQTYVVAVARVVTCSRTGATAFCIMPAGMPGGEGHWYNAIRFQKITSPEADEFDREVIDLMNRKPAREDV